MTDPRVVVAAFDVDGTLTTRDCVVPFLARFLTRPAAAARATGRLPQLLATAARRDRDRLKELATEVAVRGLPSERVEAEAVDFAALVARERLRADTLARLGWHREQGHRVVLVSASYAVYLRPLAGTLGADAVLATELEIVDGACTGRLDGANCRAAEKARRLAGWLAAERLARTDVTVWAYGDSAGDRELLAAADHPVWAAERLTSVAPTV